MIGAVLAVAVLSTPIAIRAASTTVTPVLVLRAGTSDVKKPGAYLVKSLKEWKKLEEKLDLKVDGLPLTFDVDYQKHVVIVLCSGAGLNLDYTTHEITELAGTILIR
jgi:hypothetical protein